MLKKSLSFTLAEVLLVLAIVGTVAALTIPNLANQYQDDQTVVKLKQAKNDIDLAMQQALLKYGEYAYWFSGTWSSDNKKDAIERILEFLDVTQSNVAFPYATYNNDSNYSKYELKDGSILAVKFGANGICSGAGCNVMQFIIATNGQNSTILGKNIFGFTVNPTAGTVVPYGASSDVGTNNALNVSNKINGTNWAIHMDNLDYMKCSLNWQNKFTCDGSS